MKQHKEEVEKQKRMKDQFISDDLKYKSYSIVPTEINAFAKSNQSPASSRIAKY